MTATRPAEPAGKTIRVALDAWRLRAETIVNYKAGDAKTPPTEKDIQKEFARLVAAELKVGREAILFLRSAKTAGGGAMYKVVGILHDDPKKKERIGQIEKTVREMIAKGEHRKFYL